MCSEYVQNYGFDLSKAKNSILTYSQSTDVECILIDSKGKTVYKVVPKNQCYLCEEFINSYNMEVYCEKAHLYGAYQAERFGGSYIYFCPMGLVHWATPIIIDGTMKGALLGGHILMIEPDGLLLEEVIKKFNITKDKIKDLKKFFDSIQIIPPDKVKHLADLLFIVTNHISNDHYLKFLEERELLKQESNISDYIYYLKTMGGETTGEECYPIEKEKTLLSRIALGDKEGSKNVLNEILAHIFISYGMNFQRLKARILELVVLLSRAALEGGADIEQIFGLNYNYLNQINNYTTTDELTEWILKILSRFSNCVFNLGDAKHLDAIYKSIDYMKRNYMKKISLDDVANYVNFSPTYFSRIFKEEMKCNLNKYLKKMRIEMSKDMLLESQLSIADIAVLVGFHDQSHYSKNFKDEIGISPSKYRESKGIFKF